ncbi:SDR family oxidoreductase [Dermacoccaceae bacterium W4C1]
MTNQTSLQNTPAGRSANLAGRIAVVTGAGSGIGEATSRALAARGAQVALLGRREARISLVANEIGGLAIPVDITDQAALEQASDRVRSELGAVDLVVANAGAMLAAPFEQQQRSEWQRMLEVNVLGLADTARTFAPDLLAAGEAGAPADLVLISSIGAHLTMTDYTVYFATKAAVAHLSRNLRAEWGPRGVRVRAVEPGMTASELGGDMASIATREALAAFAQQVPPIPASALGEAIAWSAEQPVGVNVSAMEVLPTRQG